MIAACLSFLFISLLPLGGREINIRQRQADAGGVRVVQKKTPLSYVWFVLGHQQRSHEIMTPPRRKKNREPTSHHYLWLCGKCYEPQTAKQSEKTFRGYDYVPTRGQPWRVVCRTCEGHPKVRLNIADWRPRRHLHMGLRLIPSHIAHHKEYMEYIHRTHTWYEKGQHPDDSTFSGWLMHPDAKAKREQIINPINTQLNAKVAISQDGPNEDSKAFLKNKKRFKIGQKIKPDANGKMPWEWNHAEFMDHLRGTISRKQLGSDKFWQGQSPHIFLQWCENAETAAYAKWWFMQSEAYQRDRAVYGPGTVKHRAIWGEDSIAGGEE